MTLRVLLWISIVLTGAVLCGIGLAVWWFGYAYLNMKNGFACAFVVEDGFRGVFVLRDGTGVEPENRFVTIRVRRDGTVVSEHAWMFSKHAWSVRYARWSSGKALPVEATHEVPDDVVALRTADANEEGIWMVVGTAEDLNRTLDTYPRATTGGKAVR